MFKKPAEVAKVKAELEKKESQAPVEPIVVSTEEVKTEAPEENEFQKSARILEDLRAGRGESDIPLDDDYWEYRNTHQLAHGKHTVRVDITETVKGKPVNESKVVR